MVQVTTWHGKNWNKYLYMDTHILIYAQEYLLSNFFRTFSWICIFVMDMVRWWLPMVMGDIRLNFLIGQIIIKGIQCLTQLRQRKGDTSSCSICNIESLTHGHLRYLNQLSGRIIIIIIILIIICSSYIVLYHQTGAKPKTFTKKCFMTPSTPVHTNTFSTPHWSIQPGYTCTPQHVRGWSMQNQGWHLSRLK